MPKLNISSQNGPFHYMYFCELMQAQSKSIKSNWSSSCGRGVRGKFTGSKKSSSDGKKLNTIIASTVDKTLKSKNKSKSKAEYDSDAKSEHYNFF